MMQIIKHIQRIKGIFQQYHFDFVYLFRQVYFMYSKEAAMLTGSKIKT